MTIKQLQEHIKKFNPCEDEYKKLLKCTSYKEGMKIVNDNIEWCIEEIGLLTLKGFDWEKLNGYDWMHLLTHQPQFANHCDWEKLDRCDWGYLSYKQPQFEQFKPKNN